MTPICEYLVSGLLPEDPKEARKIRVKAPLYKLIRGSLYRRSLYTTWLRCVAPPQTDDIVKEIHKGSCGFNIEPRSMVVRITKQGYYWASMHRDAIKVIQECEKCKEQSAITKAAKNSVIATGNGWPFSHWGANILGPLPKAPRGLKFLAITIEHSTKWVEANPLTTISGRHAERTLLRNSQKETPFSLTYGSEAIVLIAENAIAKDDKGRTKEVTKKKEGKEVALIEEAYYQNKLRRKPAGMAGSPHDKLSS
ncbi:hypothetical protein Tco_1490674 [Tanacetum coccineum]